MSGGILLSVLVKVLVVKGSIVGVSCKEQKILQPQTYTKLGLILMLMMFESLSPMVLVVIHLGLCNSNNFSFEQLIVGFQSTRSKANW